MSVTFGLEKTVSLLSNTLVSELPSKTLVFSIVLKDFACNPFGVFQVKLEPGVSPVTPLIPLQLLHKHLF